MLVKLEFCIFNQAGKFFMPQPAAMTSSLSCPLSDCCRKAVSVYKVRNSQNTTFNTTRYTKTEPLSMHWTNIAFRNSKIITEVLLLLLLLPAASTYLKNGHNRLKWLCFHSLLALCWSHCCILQVLQSTVHSHWSLTYPLHLILVAALLHSIRHIG